MDDQGNEKYVSFEVCNERTRRILDKLDSIEQRLLRIEENQRQNVREWRQFGLTVLSGIIVSIVAFLIASLR